MSRIERIPVGSPPSKTTRWRTLRRDISAAARSRLQSDAAVRTERSSKGAAASSIEIKLAGAMVRVTTGTDAELQIAYVADLLAEARDLGRSSPNTETTHGRSTRPTSMRHRPG